MPRNSRANMHTRSSTVVSVTICRGKPRKTLPVRSSKSPVTRPDATHSAGGSERGMGKPISEPPAECVASGRVTGDFDDRTGKVLRGFPRQIVTDTTVDDRVCIFAREFLGIRAHARMWSTVDQDYRFARTVVFVVQLKIPRILLSDGAVRHLCNSFSLVA